MHIRERVSLTPTTAYQGSAYIRMAQARLPLELQHLIIDFIGEEYVFARLSPHGAKDSGAGLVRTLRACSSVCKDWHRHTLRHTFYSIDFSLFDADKELQLYTKLLRMLEANPWIRRCIRRAEIVMEGRILPENVETVCSAISPIEILRVVVEPSEGDSIGLAPSLPLDGLHPILATQHLRDLSIRSARFPLHLLENLANLRSLTLQGVKTLEMDTESGRDGTWRAVLSRLERLVVVGGTCVLTQLGEAAKTNVGLCTFFKHVKHLDMDLKCERSLSDSPWQALLGRWSHLKTLVNQ